MKKKIFTVLLLSSFLHAGSVTVALAANVSYAMDALKSAFHKHYPSIEVRTVIGGSGKLSTQIQNGAPFDLFLSANMFYPETLYKEHLAITAPKIYAYGSLAMVSQRKRDLSEGIAIIVKKEIRHIAIANPKTAPYGKATIEALQNAKLYDITKHKYIYGESIAQTLSYAMTAADVGFVAKSAFYSPKMRHFYEGKNYIEVDPKLYTPITQGIVMLRHSSNNADAKKFYHFILSEEAKIIFKDYGYRL